MLFSHPIIRWLLSLRDNMIWKILGLIWFELLAPRRHPSRAAVIDALGLIRFARNSKFVTVHRTDTSRERIDFRNVLEKFPRILPDRKKGFIQSDRD